jgi:hypothetical protein
MNTGKTNNKNKKSQKIKIKRFLQKKKLLKKMEKKIISFTLMKRICKNMLIKIKFRFKKIIFLTLIIH